MDTKSQTPDQNNPPTQQTPTLNRPDLPVLEHLLNRVGFFDEAFLIL